MTETDEQLALLADTVIGAALLRKLQAVVELADMAVDSDSPVIPVHLLIEALETS